MIGVFSLNPDIDLSNSENFVLEDYDKTINYYEKDNPNFYIDNFSTKEFEDKNMKIDNEFSKYYDEINENNNKANIKSENDNIKDCKENKKDEEEKRHLNNKKIKEKEKIFLIIKKRKVHTKNNDDNIRKKIKVHMCKFMIDILNDCILFENKNNKIKIKKLNQNINANITIDHNKQLPYLKIKDILKNNQTSKQFKQQSNLINVLKLEKGIKKYPKTNELLNITFFEIGNMFLYGDKNYIKMNYGLNKAEIFSEFIEKDTKNDDYKNKVKEVAYDIFNFFINETGRKKKHQKN